MFRSCFSTLMSCLRPDAVPLPRVADIRRARAAVNATDALHAGLDSMALSERLERPDAYRQLQRERRTALEALLAVPPTEETVRRAIDLIGAICEESTWSANELRQPFDDENRPEIDLSCAETAVLLGWTQRALGEPLSAVSSRISGRMLAEVRRRLFRPVQVHEDYPFMTGAGTCPMVIAADVLLACLLLEDDPARAARTVRPALRILDEAAGQHGRGFAPLAESVADISAMADLTALLRAATGGAVDLTQNIPTGDWLDEILFAWVQNRLFIDPAGDGMSPPVSGGDVFRIGLTAGDEPLIALGALLDREKAIAPATVTGRMMDLAECERLEAVVDRPPKLRYAALRDNRLMAARIPGLYCAMHTGGGRANAGDLCLFADNVAILVDGGRDCPARNLPVIGGHGQRTRPEGACVADFEPREDREMMSVDLTRAYPAECGLRSYQRTVLTLRDERTVRVVDAMSLEAPKPVAFSFVCAARPTVLSTAVRMGGVRMTWEGAFEASVEPLEDGLHRLVLAAAEPVGQALFAFNFERS